MAEKLYNITVTETQLKAIETACHIYGRIKLGQYGHIYEDHAGMAAYEFNKFFDFEKLCRDWMRENVKDYSENMRGTAGEITFEIQRQIHAYHHGYLSDCCPCWRSDSNLSGQPNLQIRKIAK
jgi:hypothetical protein